MAKNEQDQGAVILGAMIGASILDALVAEGVIPRAVARRVIEHALEKVGSISQATVGRTEAQGQLYALLRLFPDGD